MRILTKILAISISVLTFVQMHAQSNDPIIRHRHAICIGLDGRTASNEECVEPTDVGFYSFVNPLCKGADTIHATLEVPSMGNQSPQYNIAIVNGLMETSLDLSGMNINCITGIGAESHLVHFRLCIEGGDPRCLFNQQGEEACFEVEDGVDAWYDIEDVVCTDIQVNLCCPEEIDSADSRRRQTTGQTLDKDKLFIAPNPVNTELYVNAELGNQIYIYDSHNQLAKKIRLSHSQTIDVSDLESGLYVIIVKRENKNLIEKFLKL